MYNKLNGYVISDKLITIQPILLIVQKTTLRILFNEFIGNNGAIQLLGINESISNNKFLKQNTFIYLIDSCNNIIERTSYLFSEKNYKYNTVIDSYSNYFNSNNSIIYINSSIYNCFGNDNQQIKLNLVNNYNIFENNCMSINLETNSSNNHFGNYNHNVHLFENTDSFGIYSDADCTIPKDYIEQVRIYKGSTKFYNTEEVNENNWIQNLEINCAGLSGKKELPIPTNTGYLTKVACNSNGEMKVYCEADLIQ